jgi:hypothetical protein
MHCDYMRLFVTFLVRTFSLHVSALIAVEADAAKLVAVTASTSATTATTTHISAASTTSITTPALHNATATTAVFARPVALELVLLAGLQLLFFPQC